MSQPPGSDPSRDPWNTPPLPQEWQSSTGDGWDSQPPSGGGWGPPTPGNGWEPPPPLPRGRSRRGVLLAVAAALVSLVVILGMAGRVVVGQPRPDATPTPSPPATTEPAVAPTQTLVSEPAPETPPPPPPSGAPEPEPEPEGRWELPERDWEPLPTPTPADEVWAALLAVELLDLQPPVLEGCPAVQAVSTEVEYQELIRQQWHCVHMAWLPLFEGKGWSTVEPAIQFFSGTGATSECGHLEAPAFYCSAGSGTAYFGDGHMEMAMSWDLSINEMVNHEYAHHIQGPSGITAAKMQLTQTNEIERRAELQATCLSAAMTRNSETVDFNQGDWDSWQQRLETMIIDGVHGSRESILYWGTRGLYAETLGDCNTWAVDAERVS